MKGIDVSHWQGDIDWSKVSESGIEFVIIKAGGSDIDSQTSDSSYTDPNFYKNYWGARSYGISVGAYYFAGKQFLGAVEGGRCAEKFLRIVAGKAFELPLFVDIEQTSAKFRKNATEATIAFCDKLEEWGYFAGIYASDISGYQDKLEHSKLEQYAHWVARYGKEPQICKEWQIWQRSSDGTVPGIVGKVDINESRVDYRKIMFNMGLNGYR